MPIYQYKCAKCSNDFELRKSYHEDSGKVDCPQCGKKANRVFCSPGIIFKGSGFYVTDYKSNSTIPSSEGVSDSSKEKIKKDAEAVSKPGKSTEIPV